MYNLTVILPQRKRLRLPGFDYSLKYIYFITICAFNKTKLFTEEKQNKKLITLLLELKSKYQLKVYGFCLMPNHMHLLVQPLGRQSVSKFIAEFKYASSKVANKNLWQRSFYDHIVRNNESLIETVQYILNNPVRKGLTNSSTDYPFCGTIDDLP